MTWAPGWVQRREELRKRLQLDKVLAPELEAQAAERDALAAQQQVRVLYAESGVAVLIGLLRLSSGAGSAARSPGGTAAGEGVVQQGSGATVLSV